MIDLYNSKICKWRDKAPEGGRETRFSNMDCGQCHGEWKDNHDSIPLMGDILLPPWLHTKISSISWTEDAAQCAHTQHSSELVRKGGKHWSRLPEAVWFNLSTMLHWSHRLAQHWSYQECRHIHISHTLMGKGDFLYYSNIHSKIYNSIILLG